MVVKGKKIQRAFIIYWVLLAYIIAALIWWFIALSRQNEQMSLLKEDVVRCSQEMGEGIISILLEKNFFYLLIYIKYNTMLYIVTPFCIDNLSILLKNFYYIYF